MSKSQQFERMINEGKSTNTATADTTAPKGQGAGRGTYRSPHFNSLFQGVESIDTGRFLDSTSLGFLTRNRRLSHIGEILHAPVQ